MEEQLIMTIISTNMEIASQDCLASLGKEVKRAIQGRKAAERAANATTAARSGTWQETAGPHLKAEEKVAKASTRKASEKVERDSKEKVFRIQLMEALERVLVKVNKVKAAKESTGLMEDGRRTSSTEAGAIGAAINGMEEDR